MGAKPVFLNQPCGKEREDREGEDKEKGAQSQPCAEKAAECKKQGGTVLSGCGEVKEGRSY